MADESVVQIDAAICANRVARIAQALVDLRFALQPDEAGSALADESFQLIDARGTVLTGIRSAVIDSMLTLLARITRLAGTRVIVNLIGTLAVVPTRFQRALVDVGFASYAGPSWMTDTLVAEQLVHTDSV